MANSFVRSSQRIKPIFLTSDSLTFHRKSFLPSQSPIRSTKTKLSIERRVINSPRTSLQKEAGPPDKNSECPSQYHLPSLNKNNTHFKLNESQPPIKRIFVLRPFKEKFAYLTKRKRLREELMFSKEIQCDYFNFPQEEEL